ncbi:hypothetical protein MMC32_003150 [Xylographa parallela]|nr:hypothetical protein [Xylographa parallela]
MSGWDQQEVRDEENRFKRSKSRDPWDPSMGTALAERLDSLCLEEDFLLGNEKWVIKRSFSHGYTSAAVKLVCNPRRNTELFVCKAVLPTKFTQEVSTKLTQQIPREVRILRDLLPRTERLCAILEYFPAPQNVFLMEYCDGGDVERLASRYQRIDEFLPESFLWHILLQGAEGLAYIHHGRGQTDVDKHGWGPIIHADIKPENLFLQWRPGSDPAKDYPDLKIGDFGLSIIVNERTDKPPYIYPAGTDAWKPPEVPLVSFKADIWALGAVIHYLCHGREPIEVPASDWKSRATTRQTIPVTRIYSSSLQYWLDRVLAIDEVERVDSAILADSLAGIVPVILREKDPLDAWAARRTLDGDSAPITRNGSRDSQNQQRTGEDNIHDDERSQDYRDYVRGHTSLSSASSDARDPDRTLLQELNALDPEYVAGSEWPPSESW